MKITVSVDGGPAHTFDYETGASVPETQARIDLQPEPVGSHGVVVATWPAEGYQQLTQSENYLAGDDFSIALDVSGDTSKTAMLDVSQAGSLGGGRKDVFVSPNPGDFTTGALIIAAQNSARTMLGLNYPQAGVNLTPGRWYINVRLLDPCAALVILSAQ